MIVPCPFCGPRDAAEFRHKGDATPRRPAYEDGEAAFVDYVYYRENPAGLIQELWYHALGCRSWLVVERDTRTHIVHGATLAAGNAS